MRHTVFASIFVALLVLCCTASATVIPAPPSIPMSVKGTVDIAGVPAPVGTVIQANGTNVRTGVSGNPFTLTTAGTLWGGTWDPQMFIQGSGLTTGTAISFTIDGQPAMVRQAGSPDWTTYVSFTSGGVCTVELDTGPDPSSSPSGLPPTPAVEPTVPEPTPTPAPPSPPPTLAPTPAPTLVSLPDPDLSMPVVPLITWGPGGQILAIQYWDYPNAKWVTITLSDYR